MGKTCFLSSLSLLFSQGELMPEFLFSGCLTLQGFEERARGLRSWSNRSLPDQLVEHTRLLDPEQAACMHLGIKENKPNGKFIDLLLTDLPGEWTDKMIDNSSAAERFVFLKRADCILYIVDGIRISNKETKHFEIYRTNLAIDRLVHNVKNNQDNPIVFVISKGDEIGMQLPDGVRDIKEHAEQYGLSTSVVLTVAFSRRHTEIKSGLGIIDAIKVALMPFVPSNNNGHEQGERSFWSG